MSEEASAPVVANTTTGEVSADLSEAEDERIARPARWVSSLLWVMLVLTLSIVAVGSAAALILDFIAPSNPPSPSKDTILLIHTGNIAALLALYSNRPGSR